MAPCSLNEKDKPVSNLFQRDGKPLRFYLGLSTKRNQIETIIKQHGGIVVEELPQNAKWVNGGNALDENGFPIDSSAIIVLVDSNAKYIHSKRNFAKLGNCFSMTFIDSCIQNGKLLDLETFSVHPRTKKSLSSPVSRTRHAAKRFQVSEELEPTVTTTRVFEQHSFSSASSPVSVKKIRQKYTHEHDLILLKFAQEMLKRNPHLKPLGQKIWRKAEVQQILGPHRSWQSMRERFKTHLQPYLHQDLPTVATLVESELDLNDPVQSLSENSCSTKSSDADNILEYHIPSTFPETVQNTELEEIDGRALGEHQEPYTSAHYGISTVESKVSKSSVLEREIDRARYPLGAQEDHSDSSWYFKHATSEEEATIPGFVDNGDHAAHLIQETIKELSKRYKITEKRACSVLLRANGSVDQAITQLEANRPKEN